MKTAYKNPPPVRAAVITGGARSLAEVAAYLPSNFLAVEHQDTIYIVGEDSNGWTMNDYVIPRLASGLIYAKEI